MMKTLVLRLFGYKTFADLQRELREGKRDSITSEEIRRAGLLQGKKASEFHLPKTGDIYLCLEDTPLLCLTYWKKPFTGSEQVVFPKGEKIMIGQNANEKLHAVNCMPVEKKKMELRFVPQTTLGDLDYDGYSLSIDLSQLGMHFIIVK